MSELKDFKGKKLLDGVDFSNEPIKTWDESYENSEVCRFRLDGVIYAAIEDPNDGYRSHMKDLVTTDEYVIKNTFEPIEVLCKHRDSYGYGGSSDILQLIDTITSEVVLEVGTDKTDDYYPFYVAKFTPEAMILNKEPK